MKKLLIPISFLFVIGSFFLVNAASASFVNEAAIQAGYAGGEAGFSNAVDPRLIAAQIIKLALTFVGTILFALNIYAGYNWMTAGGNEDKIATSKKTIRNSTIGLIIVLSAYAITIAATNLAQGRDVGSNAGSGSSFEDAIQNWFKTKTQ
jgi:hypothetical protein